ncbi:MAG: exodeoxyribonuclease VII large subunit [Mycoplasma sp.]
MSENITGVNNNTIYTVEEFNLWLKEQFSRAPRLRNASIKGEISNFSVSKEYGYFSIKDEKSQIQANCFNRTLVKEIEQVVKSGAGNQVIVTGEVSIYVPRGSYSINVKKIDYIGKGSIEEQLKQLHDKLKKEGLFDQLNKLAIPKFPSKIGIITAIQGAALRDMWNTIKRRYTLVDVYLFPSLVQGDGAKNSIVQRIKQADSFELDVIILARGGGSKEDLWSFNEEEVVRAVAKCRTPIITGVGHEIDTTLVDYASDYRAETPTAAAEKATPDSLNLLQELKTYNRNLYNHIIKIYDVSKKNLALIQSNKHRGIENIVYAKNIMFQEITKDFSDLWKNFILSQSNFLIKNRTNMTNYIGNLVRSKKQLLLNSNEMKLSAFERYLSLKNQESKSLFEKLENLGPKNILAKNIMFQKITKDFSDLRKNFILSQSNFLIKNQTNMTNYIGNLVRSKKQFLLNSNEMKLFAFERYLLLKNRELKSLFEKLENLGPKNILKRGYSIVKIDNMIINNSSNTKIGDKINITMYQGTVEADVIKIGDRNEI